MKVRTEHALRERAIARAAENRELVTEIGDVTTQLETLLALRRAPALAPIKARKKVGGKQRTGVPFALFSDWHVEETVTRAQTNGENEYNLEIAERCIAKAGDAFVDLVRGAVRFDCRDAVIWLGGDLFSGYIHEELVEGNGLSPTRTVLWLQVRIERMLRRIAAGLPALKTVRVVCNDGNHGRLTHKIRVSTRTANSLEWLLYHNLAARLSDDARFQFQIAESEWNYLDVFGATFGFTHGDSFQSGGGVGGITIPIRRGLERMHRAKKVHHVAMGHFHQRIDLGDVAINGSMIGYTPFAARIHAAAEKRQQSFFMVDSERGKCISAPVWL